jgi:hypothetical protein
MNKKRISGLFIAAILASIVVSGVAEAGTSLELKTDYIVNFNGNSSSFADLQTGKDAGTQVRSGTSFVIGGTQNFGESGDSLASEDFRSLGNFGSSGYFSKPCNTLSVVAVPEPETYALLLTGIGMLGFMARHRKNSSK